MKEAQIFFFLFFLCFFRTKRKIFRQLIAVNISGLLAWALHTILLVAHNTMPTGLNFLNYYSHVSVKRSISIQRVTIFSGH